MNHIQDILLWACYLHALAAVMAVASILYWVQFHYKIGPTAINMSRVVIDVTTMFVIYILIIKSHCLDQLAGGEQIA